MDFQTEVFDNQDKKNVQQFLHTVFKDVIAPKIDPRLPEMMGIGLMKYNDDPTKIHIRVQRA